MHSVDCMNLYLRDIHEDAILTAAEEIDLAGSIQRGDQAALDRMVVSSLRLVVSTARAFTRRGLSIDDLVGEGNIGLISAAKKFDPAFGVRFSTYATYWIRKAILDALANRTAEIRVPGHMVLMLSAWRKTERALGHATFDQVAASMGLTDLQKVLVASAQKSARRRDEVRDDWQFSDEPDQRENPVVALDHADEMAVTMARVLAPLDPRERAILSLHYDLGGAEPLGLTEVGKRVGVKKQLASRIQRRAIKKLADLAASSDLVGPARGGWQRIA